MLGWLIRFHIATSLQKTLRRALTGAPSKYHKRLMNYLPDFLYVTVLVHAEGLDCHSFIVVDAFPNISKSPRCNRMLSCLDEAFGYRVGSGD